MVESLQEAYAELVQAQVRIERHAVEAEETRELFERVIESMSEALLLVDRKGRLVTVNRAACELLEREREKLIGSRLAGVWPGPDVPTTVWQLLERAPSGSLAMLDVEARPPSGRLMTVQVDCNVVRDKRQRISGLLLVARDITARRREEEGQRLLADASAILGASLDHWATLQRLVDRVASERADWCVAYQRSGDILERVGLAGTPPEMPARIGDEALTGDDPLLRALARGQHARRPSAAEPRERQGDDETSWLVAPMLVGHRSFGMLAVGRSMAPELDSVDGRFMQELAHRAAQAIYRAQLHYAAEHARGEAEEAANVVQRVQDVSDVALSHLDLRNLLPDLLDPIVEALELEGALFVPLDEEPGRLAPRAARGFDTAQADRLAALVRQSARSIAKAHRPVALRPDRTRPARVESAIPPQAGVLAAPLRVGSRLTGVLVVAPATSRPLSDADLRLLDLVADRAALAIENARLYEQQRGIAETLQRSLLPKRLPRTAGIAIAERYFPGGAGTEVGGDWYDVIALPSGDLAVMVGDVVGRGIRAAAEMGQLRNSLRTYLFEGHDPAEAITRLHRLSRSLLDDTFATVLCLLLDPSSGRFTFSSAGHPPPLLVASDASATLLEEGRSPALGTGLDDHDARQELVLEPGSSLLLYTDGLIERRNRGIDEGLARLRAAGASGPDVIDSLLDHVVAEMFPSGEPRDDVALLGLRRVPAHARLHLRLPTDPAALGQMRDRLRRWLGERGLDPADLKDIVVACNELCTNAIKHPLGAREPFFELDLDASPEQLAVTVADSGRWREHSEASGMGFGLDIARGVMDSVDVETSESGTRVRMCRTLADRNAETLAVPSGARSGSF